MAETQEKGQKSLHQPYLIMATVRKSLQGVEKKLEK